MLLPTLKASKVIGVHPNTLRKWADEGQIRVVKTKSGRRLFDVDQFLTQGFKRNICYCRVSSKKQSDDLERQINFMRTRYPHYEIISDIGSGLNFKRKHFEALLESICKREIGEVVVAHRDRLSRFGFQLIKWLIEYHGGKLVVLDETKCSPQQELVTDLLSIIHVFSCRIHGLRKYANEIKEDKTCSERSSEVNSEEVVRNIEVCV